jgi:hypothetical protein
MNRQHRADSRPVNLHFPTITLCLYNAAAHSLASFGNQHIVIQSSLSANSQGQLMPESGI